MNRQAKLTRPSERRWDCVRIPGLIGNGSGAFISGTSRKEAAFGTWGTAVLFVLSARAVVREAILIKVFRHSISGGAHIPSPTHRMKIIRVGLDGLSAMDKVAKSLFIESKMAANPTFPTPSPTLVVLGAAREALEAAVAATLNGGKSATFAKDEAEAALDELITQLAGYVVSVAGGDEGKILSSGFDVRKRGSPIGNLPAPANVHADLTNKEGQIKVDWERLHGAVDYEVQRNDNDPKVEVDWKVIGMTTKSRYLDQGLESGSIHWYRVKARGTAGDSPLSDPARAMAR